MAATFQITVLVATFIFATLLGTIFDVGYFQTPILAEEKLDDLPLPVLTSVLSENHRALGYLMMLPWVLLAGGPFFDRGRSYFDTEMFLLRFATFFAVESLLALFLLLFLLLPFVPYYMLSDIRPNTIFEWAVTIGFWGLVVATLGLGIVHKLESRKRNEAE